MPVFEIEQYEIHTTKFRVEADSEAEAIVKLLDGEADAVDDSQEYIEVAEDIGLPVDENRELAKRLVALGVPVGEHIIPSIRSVEQVEVTDSWFTDLNLASLSQDGELGVQDCRGDPATALLSLGTPA